MKHLRDDSSNLKVSLSYTYTSEGTPHHFSSTLLHKSTSLDAATFKGEYYTMVRTPRGEPFRSCLLLSTPTCEKYLVPHDHSLPQVSIPFKVLMTAHFIWDYCKHIMCPTKISFLKTVLDPPGKYNNPLKVEKLNNYLLSDRVNKWK